MDEFQKALEQAKRDIDEQLDNVQAEIEATRKIVRILIETHIAYTKHIRRESGFDNKSFNEFCKTIDFASICEKVGLELCDKLNKKNYTISAVEVGHLVADSTRASISVTLDILKTYHNWLFGEEPTVCEDPEADASGSDCINDSKDDTDWIPAYISKIAKQNKELKKIKDQYK